VVGESEVVVTSKRVSGRSEYLQIGEGFLLAKSRLQGMTLRRMLNIDSTLVNIGMFTCKNEDQLPQSFVVKPKGKSLRDYLMF
jgi:hypothetical protein